MKRLGSVAFGAATLVAVLSMPAQGAVPKAPKPPKPDRDSTTILVKFAPQADAARAVSAAGDEVVGRTETRVEIVKVKAGASLDAKLAEYEARPDVEFAEPNYIAYTSVVGTPNDPSYGQQWALSKIQAPQGWSIYPGSYGVAGGAKVAVVDTGVQSTHPDLQGQVDTADGGNCVNGSSTCAADPALDDNGHGTHVAGIVAAATNNGAGVAGTAYSSQVIPVKVLGSNGSGTYAAITNGILWAADHGARVISMSLGGSSYSQTLCNAITQVLGRGVLVVAAAGNNGSTAASYPAACPGTVGVAATDQNDGRPSWTDSGVPDVFVSAPGVSIYSTYPTNSYATLSGTSMATPFVSGLAALLFGQAPSRTPTDVKQILATTSDKVGGVPYGSTDPYNTCGCSFNDGYGYGRINVYRALSAAGAAAPVQAPTVTLTSTPASSTTSTSASFSWTTTNSPTSTTCSLDNAAATACSSPQGYSGLSVGSHSFTVTVSNGGGSNSASYSWTVNATVSAPTVTLTSTPASSTTSTSASFSWTTTNSPTSTTCSLDNAAATACSSPQGYSGLSVGSHSFTVTVSNGGGSNSASFNWTVTAAAPPAPTYNTITARHSGLCLYVSGGSTSAGATVVQSTCNGADAQKWQLVAAGGGYYTIVVKHTGDCLDVFYASQVPGGTVGQWPCNGGTNQQWQLVATSNGYVNLVARHSGQCLDVFYASTASGATVGQYTCNGGTNQQWLVAATT